MPNLAGPFTSYDTPSYLRSDGTTPFADANQLVPYANMVQPGEKKIMMVDVGEFVRTRDAVSFNTTRLCDCSIVV